MHHHPTSTAATILLRVEPLLLRIASADPGKSGQLPNRLIDRFRSTGQVRDAAWGTQHLRTWAQQELSREV